MFDMCCALGKMFFLIVLFAVLGVGAHDVTCDVTHGPGGTSYRVPESSGTDCEFSWSNSTHVVANHQLGIKPLVLNHSMNVLTTQTCFEQVYYKRDCISEGFSHNATCTTTCLRHAERVNDPGPSAQMHRPRYHACIAPIAAFIILVLGIFSIIRWRKRCCSNTGVDV